MVTKLEKIKFKINNTCMNECSFCQFNNNPEKLYVKDLNDFFNKISKNNFIKFRRIIINGGEPTIHPEFLDISKYLKDRFEGNKIIQLGSNLKLFEISNKNTQKRLEAIFETYQKVSIGCDDEHQNIDIVEKLIPEFYRRRIKININSINGYYSNKTMHRLLNLKKKYGVNLMFSPLAHYWEDKPFLGNPGLCRDRRRDFLVNCNGDAFFCYQQELMKPVFNIHCIDQKVLNYYLFEYIPSKKYNFCMNCEKFIKDEH